MTQQNEQAPVVWTEEEATAFAQTLVTFRDGLPSRRRDACTAILAMAAEAGGDVQGYAVTAPPVLQFHSFVETPGVLVGTFRVGASLRSRMTPEKVEAHSEQLRR